MPVLNQRTFAQLQQDLANQYSAIAAIPANLAAGSSLGAIFNAFALLGMNLQQQVAYVNQVSRLLTSTGADVDSFITPFGLTRNPAVAATVAVTFGAPSVNSGSTIVIPIGTIVQTNLITSTTSAVPIPIQFSVIADSTQSGYSSAQNGYLIPNGSQFVTATVQALVAGTSGNVAANQITLIGSTSANPAPAGVTTVNNTGAAVNGANAETDAAYIARFQAFIANRWATDNAIATAISTSQAGLTYIVADQLDANGNLLSYNVTCIVGQVPGAAAGTSSATLTTVGNAVALARPAGIPVQVVGPTMLAIPVTATLTLASGAVAANVVSAAQAAVAAYINGIGLPNSVVTTPAAAAALTTTVSYSSVVNALSAVVGVKSASLVTVSAGTSDVTVAFGQQAYSSLITLTTQ